MPKGMIIVLIVLLLILLVIMLRVAFGPDSQYSSGNRGFRFHDLLNTASIKGKYAEMGVSSRLRRMDDGYRVFDDIMIRCSWGTAQIDHIVVSKFGIFVIETKNYNGKIYGGESSDNWKQYLRGREYVMINPVRQNQVHIRALMECMPTYHPLQYMSVVAFDDGCELRTRCHNVVYIYQLTKYISESRNEEILANEQVDEYCRLLVEKNIVSVEERMEHNRRVAKR